MLNLNIRALLLLANSEKVVVPFSETTYEEIPFRTAIADPNLLNAEIINIEEDVDNPNKYYIIVKKL